MGKLMGSVIFGLLVFLSFTCILASSAQADSPSLAALLEKAEHLNLASDPQWLHLGHYKKGYFGGLKSEVSGKAFFLAADGATNPESELKATLQGFFATEERPFEALYPADGSQLDRQHPRCQFPARYLWLQKKLAIDPAHLPPADCERFQKYRKRLAARSVSLVFSSYYLNNPSSAFGHSFLRLNRTESTAARDRYELLDHGINFAAEVTTENALMYALYGLTGGFRGTYSSVPYYFKVREYNDFEARDLWSYDLDLTPEELELLVAHLWELGSTYFGYFYFRQNCSYQILTAIEAAAPRYSITAPLPPYVIPADTIRQAVKTPGLVQGISYRPSVRSIFFHRLKSLSPGEEVILGELVSAKNEAQLDSALKKIAGRDRSAPVLDAAIDYLDYKYPKDLIRKETESAKRKQKLLLARSSIPVRSESVEFIPPEADRPHAGHESARASLVTGHEKATASYSELGIRFALHDMLDDGSGYPSHSQIEFMNIQARYYWEMKSFEIENIALLRILSLNPVTFFNQGPSWRVEFGAKRIRDAECERCFGGMFEVGVGYAIEPWTSVPVTLFSLAELETTYSASFPASKARVGLGPSAGILLGKGRLKSLTQGRYRYQFLSLNHDAYQLESELRWTLQRSWALGLRGALHPGFADRNWTAGLSAYFYY